MSAAGKRKADDALDGQSDPEQQKESKKEDASDEESTKSNLSALADAALQAQKTETAATEPERPVKKAKATSKNGETVASASAKDAIQNALSRLSSPSKLSDYEKCSIFPQKLMQLLKNEEAPDAIWWLEDGESFAIEQEQFTKIMNKVSRTSKKQVKLDSILRNLYRWGFKKLKDRDLPPNVLAYSHPKFKRDACVELQTFSKKSEPSQSEGSTHLAGGPPPTALARALSARAQAGYGENWNEEGAADNKTTLMMQQQHNPYSLLQAGQRTMMPGMGAGMGAGIGGMPGGDQRMMQMMLQQQHQHQRQMLLHQELMLQEQQQRHHQLLLEAAAAEQYAAQRFGGGAGAGSSFRHQFPPNHYPF